jgi:hypothetical protein
MKKFSSMNLGQANFCVQPLLFYDRQRVLSVDAKQVVAFAQAVVGDDDCGLRRRRFPCP